TVTAHTNAKACSFETLCHFSWHVASAREFVRCAYVVKQPPFGLEHACEFIVEVLRVQIACDAEAWWIVQYRIECASGMRGDLIEHVRMRERQPFIDKTAAFR